VDVSLWSTASFENEAASDWFYAVEEAVEPGFTISSALDRALGEADHLDLDAARQAVAAAELSACCAGRTPEGLPDHVLIWTQTHSHRPHDAEIDQAVDAVLRVRGESELRDRWTAAGSDQEAAWLGELDDLVSRLRESGAGSPPVLSP
jgi:hypothetical protein